MQHFDAQYLDASAGAQLKVVEAAELNKAEAQLMAVRAAQKSALTHIYAIARPVLPTYLLGLLFMIVARCFEVRPASPVAASARAQRRRETLGDCCRVAIRRMSSARQGGNGANSILVHELLLCRAGAAVGRGPSRAKSASRSLLRALLTPQVNAGSLYRCAKST